MANLMLIKTSMLVFVWLLGGGDDIELQEEVNM